MGIIPPLPSESDGITGQRGTVAAAVDIGTLYNDDDRSIEQKYGELLAPRFEIEISDSTDAMLWSAESMIQNNSYDLNGIIVNDVTFEEDIEGADMISITINNPDLTLQDSRLFVEGNNIDLWMGYDGRRAFYMGRGLIVQVEPEFPQKGMPTIKLTAYDKSYYMMEEGKAEIVPEGSEWWQRRREQSQRIDNEETIAISNRYLNNTPDGDDLAEIERENAAVEASGGPAGFRPRVGAGDLRASGTDVTSSDQPIRLARVPQANIFSGLTGFEDPNRQSRTSWQPQRFGRRRRNAGKVWRGKTDSEIVSAIFLSYEIDPYVEATRERTRRASGTPAANRPRGARSGHPNPAREFYSEQRHLNLESRDRELDAAYESTTARRARDEAAANTVDDAEIAYEYSGPNDPGSDEDPETASDYPSSWRYIVSRDPNTIPIVQLPTPTHAPGRDRRLREVTQKAGTTDWQFITKLAEKHGYIVFVFFHIDSRRWIGYWGPESNVPQSVKYVFRYNAGDQTTIGDIRPNTSIKNQSTEIDLLYVDPVTRRTNRLRVAMDNVDPNFAPFRGVVQGSESNQDPIGDGPEVTLTVAGQRVRVNANHRFTSAEDARQWLMSYWLRHAEDYMHMSGNMIVGLPECRARERHEFQGIGRYAGEAFITEVRHAMSPGQIYETSFTIRKSADFNQDDLGDDMVVLDQEIMGQPEVEPLDPTAVLAQVADAIPEIPWPH
jgi:phage protein D